MISTSKFSVGSVITFLVVLLAFYYKQNSDNLLRERLEGTLSGLLRAERKARRLQTTRPRIAVGFGSCQDVIVQSADVLKNLTPPDAPEHFDSIDSLEELLKLYVYFFQHGAAAERYIRNSSLLEDLVASSLAAPSGKWSMGGNAPVMASRFAAEGCPVLLGAQMSQRVKDVLPQEIQVSGPITQKDDVHLLLEYPAQMTWGPYVAPRANRLIVHSDSQNPMIQSLEIFRSQLQVFKPDLLVIGGLQMMDNFPYAAGVREARLKVLGQMLSEQPTSTLIHFEMASFTEEDLLHSLLEDVFLYSDSLGMNEQELPNLLNLITHGNISLVSDAYPRVATVLDQMRDLFKLLEQRKVGPNSRQISRLHIHTLAFQAIMTTKGSRWKNSMSAAAKAALTAHRHTCGSDRIDTQKARLIMDDSFTTSRQGEDVKRVLFNSQRPIACWEEKGKLEICVAPVLVCTEVIQTGGGGDNVSSAGLVLQV